MKIPPESYIEQMKEKPYSELIRQRDMMVQFMHDFEKKEMAGDRSGSEWDDCPKPDTRYQVSFYYLAKLCRIMPDKYYDEYDSWLGRFVKQRGEDI